MVCYVDDMQAPYGRMTMCHMIGDTDEELHAMALKIGVHRRWFQGDHYDICKSKRALAVQHGAQEITWRQASCMMMFRRFGQPMGKPKTAIERFKEYKQIDRNRAMK